MDRMNDKLVEYRGAYKEFYRTLVSLNPMTFNEPYRSLLQAFGKELAQHELIINAIMGISQPPPLMFISYEGQASNGRTEDDLGVRVPIPAYLAQYNVSSEYTEDQDE